MAHSQDSELASHNRAYSQVVQNTVDTPPLVMNKQKHVYMYMYVLQYNSEENIVSWHKHDWQIWPTINKTNSILIAIYYFYINLITEWETPNINASNARYTEKH